MNQDEEKIKIYEYNITSADSLSLITEFTWIPSEKICIHQDRILYRDTKLFSVKNELEFLGIPYANLCVSVTSTFMRRKYLNEIKQAYEKLKNAREIFQREKEQYEKESGLKF